jgi:hypothetical protein
MDQSEKLEALVQLGIDRGVDFKPMFAWIPEDKDALIQHFIDHELYMAILTYKPLARALFGEEQRKYQGLNLQTGELLTEDELKKLPKSPPAWKLHLQQAVISKDPIGYFYQAAFGEEV